jgi:hypothetical protein
VAGNGCLLGLTKAIDLGRDPAGFLGGSMGSRLRLKTSCLQLTSLDVLVAHLTSCNFAVSHLCVSRHSLDTNH